MDHFFTWATLGTFAGASAATTLITQIIKRPLARIPTQFVSYAVALAILLLATAATGAAGWTEWVLVPLNALIVSMAANGAFTAIVRTKNGK